MNAGERTKKFTQSWVICLECESDLLSEFKAVQREAVEKPIKQLQKCADWLMTARGYLPFGGAKLIEECENETRALIKELKEET